MELKVNEMKMLWYGTVIVEIFPVYSLHLSLLPLGSKHTITYMIHAKVHERDLHRYLDHN